MTIRTKIDQKVFCLIPSVRVLRPMEVRSLCRVTGHSVGIWGLGRIRQLSKCKVHTPRPSSSILRNSLRRKLYTREQEDGYETADVALFESGSIKDG